MSNQNQKIQTHKEVLKKWEPRKSEYYNLKWQDSNPHFVNEFMKAFTHDYIKNECNNSLYEAMTRNIIPSATIFHDNTRLSNLVLSIKHDVHSFELEFVRVSKDSKNQPKYEDEYAGKEFSVVKELDHIDISGVVKQVEDAIFEYSVNELNLEMKEIDMLTILLTMGFIIRWMEFTSRPRHEQNFSGFVVSFDDENVGNFVKSFS